MSGGGRRLAERVALVALGLALPALPEGVLRLAGFGGRPPLLLALSADGEGPAGGLREINPEVAAPFFARGSEEGVVLGGHRREVVPVPKPPEELRVVVAGASTVEGFPMPGNVTAARFFEAGLARLLPDRPVRVVNLGVTAVASFPVRDLALRALDEIEPDLLVIYSGHNELFGAAGVASWQRMGGSVGAMRAAYALRRLALWQGLRSLLPSSSRSSSEAPDAGGRARPPELVDLMPAVDAVEPGGPLHERARRNLETNLRAVAAEARRRGVPLILSTPASNVRDLAPIGSWTVGLDPALAAAAEAATPATPARELARLAVEAPAHAGVAWALARSLEERDPAAAADLYARARDLDSRPWRAPGAVSGLVRRVALEERAELADVEAAFAAAVDRPPGWDLFADHLHPNLEGQALLAATWLRAAAEDGLDGLSPQAVRAVDWRAVARDLGWNRLDAYLLARKMIAFFRDGPLGRGNAGAVDHFEREAADLEAAFDPVERRAAELWSAASDEAGRFVPIAWFGGVASLEAGAPARAAAYLRAAGDAAGFAADERAAARLLEVLALVGADPSAAASRLAASRREAETRAASAFPPTAVTLRALAGLRALTGDADGAREVASRASELLAAAAPASGRYLGVLPETERLLASGEPTTPGR